MSTRPKQRKPLPPRRRQRSGNTPAVHVPQLLEQACQLHQLGELALARQLYETVLIAAPQNADALHLLGVIDHQQGDHASATERIGRSLRIAPSSTAFSNLSTVYQAVGQQREALAAAQQAVLLEPHFIDGLMNLGKCEVACGYLAQAERTFRRALEVSPGNIEATGQLAYLLETGDGLQEAETLVTAALPNSPANVLLNLVAAKCERRGGQPDAARKRLTGLLDVSREAAANRFVHFELGMLHDRASNPAAAFQRFAAANRLARQRSPFGSYEENPQVKEIRLLADVCRAGWHATWSSAVPPGGDPSPVFLFGFPRSGTTLLDQMLDSHPALQTYQEVPALWHVIKEIGKLPAGYPAALANLSVDQIERFRGVYFAAIRSRRPRVEGTQMVDTNPLATIHLPLILRLFPDARLVMELRHPLDVCLSCFMQDFKLNAAMANFTDLHETASLYRDVMQLWNQYCDFLPFKYHAVRYEELVGDAEQALRTLCDFLGVGWDDAMLRFAEHARGRGRINTPSYHQVTEGIYRRSTYRHQRYMDQLAPIRGIVDPFIGQFGYE